MSKSKRNVLLVICDQLSAQALPAWGNQFAQTPNINSVVETGVRFENAYTICPLCQPTRAAFWTGLYTHQTGVLSNGRLCPVPEVSESIPTLGSVFSEAGYKTVHFGKQHDAGALRGFEKVPMGEREVDDAHPAWPVFVGTRRERNTRHQVVDFLTQQGSDKPYFAVADLVNPHEICGWIGTFHGHNELVRYDGELPHLPANLYRDPKTFAKLPLPVQYICCAHNRQAQIAEWNEEKIQHYLLAYHHYLTRVDREIGKILEALRQRPDADNTLIVFMSDHGDSMCGRWMATKHTSFYDETVRVPFVFSGPGVQGADRSVKGLVSQLDLFPTLCDYARLETGTSLEGRSLVPWLEGRSEESPHRFVVSQWHTEWGSTIEPGRMVRTERYKYTHYLEGHGEELYDLETDPGEINTLIDQPDHAAILDQHRALLGEHVKATEDPFFALEWKAEPRWREHAPGYQNHRGVAAPSVYFPDLHRHSWAGTK